MDLNHIGRLVEHWIALGSLASLLLSVIEGWARNQGRLHPAKAWTIIGDTVEAVNDLISRFAAINWRDKLVPPAPREPWTEEQRKAAGDK